MNWEAVKPIAILIFTSLLKIVGAGLVTHGVISSGAGLETFTGAAMTAGGAIWSWWVQSGHVAAANYLKKLTDTATQAAAIEVAKRMPAAADTGTAAPAKAIVTSISPALMAKDAAKSMLILFGIFAVGLMSVQPASAQLRPLTGNLKRDLAPATSAASAPLAGLQGFMDQLAKIQTKLVDDTVADMTSADADAATLINPGDNTSFRDPISHACYPAAIKFLQSIPASTPPTGTLIAVQLFQKKRDFVAQIQAGLPVYLKLGCAPLLGDEAAIFTKLMGLLGVNVALNTILPGSGALSALAF